MMELFALLTVTSLVTAKEGESRLMTIASLPFALLAILNLTKEKT